MSNKENPTSEEAPQITEPQKPIPLVNVVEVSVAADPGISGQSEVPMAEDGDILELSEEVGNDPGESALQGPKPGKTQEILAMIQEETQPSQPKIQRTSTLDEFRAISVPSLEILKNKREELNRILLAIHGNVRDETSLKIVGGDLLGVMRISKENEDLKNITDAFLLLTTPKPSGSDSGVFETKSDFKEDPESPLAYARNFRSGIYLVLKMENGNLRLLGKRHAEKLKPEIIDEFFRSINNADDFFALSQKIENVGEAREAQKGEKADEGDPKSLASNS